MIIVNFKNYNPTKHNIFSLAFSIKELNERYGKIIYLAPPTIFLNLIKDVPLISQGAYHSFGSNTGKISVETLKEFTKIEGVLLNHSENQLLFNDLIKTIKKTNELNLDVIVCADSKESALALNTLNNSKELKIDYIAYEPPELIGGDVSVSKAKPEIIEELTNKINNLLVGAGIKTKEDVKKALELGAKGILVASGVVKAENPYKILEEFITCF
jgi:triosephosphate isomerase